MVCTWEIRCISAPPRQSLFWLLSHRHSDPSQTARWVALSDSVTRCLLPPPEKQVYHAAPGKPRGCFVLSHPNIDTRKISCPFQARPRALTTRLASPACLRASEGLRPGTYLLTFCVSPRAWPQPTCGRTKRPGNGGTCPLQTHCRLPGGRQQQNPSVPGTSLKPLGIVLSQEKNSQTLVGSTMSAAGEARSH